MTYGMRGKIPEEWNIAQIINIHKRGHTNRCKNYEQLTNCQS
jgi:hypothetical protein